MEKAPGKTDVSADIASGSRFIPPAVSLSEGTPSLTATLLLEGALTASLVDEGYNGPAPRPQLGTM